MDTIVRVVYEGTTYDLHLAEDLPLRLDISAVEAGEVGSFFSVGSQEFYLPGTKENNTFFNHAYNISSDDIPGMYNSVQAYIIKKGETVLEGQLQLHEVVTNINTEYVMYKCTIVDSVISFKDQLASKLIKDADWSPYSHSISSQSILESWEGSLNNGSIFYPLAEYGYDTSVDESNMPVGGFIPLGNPTVGQYYNQPFTPLLPLQLLPSVRAKDVVDVIFDQVNFIPTGSWYEDGRSNNLFILPKGQEEGGVTVAEGLTPTFNAYMSGFPLQSVSSSAYNTIGDDVHYNAVTTNNLNQYDTACYRYVTKGVGTHKFNASVTFFNPVWNSPGQTVEIRLKIVSGTKICGNPGSSSYVNFTSETIQLTSGDGFNSFTIQAGGEDFVTSPGQDWWVYVEYVYTTSGPVAPLTLYMGQFACTRAPQVYDGVTIDMGEQFDSRTKSLDVITGLLQQFNLVLQPDPTNERAIRIDYFDEWVRDGRFVDWTDRYDTSKNESINHTIDEVQRILTFKQEKDEDRFSKLAIDNVPNLEYGSIEVIADNNLSQGERSIGSYFGPLILQAPFEWNSLDQSGNRTWNIDTSINMSWPALYKLDNNNIKTFKFKPRIGYKSEIDIKNNYKIYFGNPGDFTTLSGSYYTLTNTENYPAISGSSEDTLYNNTFGSFVNADANLNNSISSFQGNWKTYVDSLYWEGSKKLTIDVEFNSNDYKDIRLNDKVYVKDNYYRINKISGFNISKDDLAKVELIKLYPAYFQQDVVNVPVPVAPVAPVPISPPTPAPTVTPAPTIAPVSPSPSPVTPVTPSPVTPVPIQPRPPATIGTFYLTQASGTTNTCALNTTTVVYALTTTLSDIGSTVNTLYADPQCSVPYFGNGYYYGISGTQGVLPTYELVVMGTGVVTGRTTCPTVTPAPTSAGEFYRGSAQGSSTNACSDTVNQGSLFVPYAPSVEYVQSNDYVYTDAGFSTTFSGSNSWYGLSNPGIPTAQMAIQVNDFGRVVSRIDCVPLPPAPPPPSPSPAPITVGTFYLSDILGTSGPGCTSTTDGYTVYAATTDINDILSGSVSQVFSDNTLSTGFFGNGWYYGVSDVSSGSAKGTLEIVGTGFFAVASDCTTLGSMTSASIDNGSTIGGEGCFNDPTQTVYLRDDLSTILNAGSGVAYSDIYTNDGFPGTSGRYMIHQSASVDPAGNSYPEARGIVTINALGVIGVASICGNFVTEFSASTNGNLSVDICNQPFNTSVFSDTITSTSQLTNGTRLYTNANLNVELTDNQNYVISDISGSTGYSVTGSSFRYFLIAGASNVADCIPAPPPPVPPILDPLYSSSISQGYTFGYGCFSPVTGSVYHTKPLEEIAVSQSGCFYSDIYGQFGFNGQNLNYRIQQSGSTIASGSGTTTYGGANITTAIANTGCITVFRQNCGTGSAFQFYATEGSTLTGTTDQCSSEVGDFVNTFYTTDFYNVEDAVDCDRIYRDVAQTVQLGDSSRWAIANDERCFGYESGSYARRIRYSLIVCGGAGGLTLEGPNSGSCSSPANSQGYNRLVGPRKENITGTFTCGSELPGATWQYYYLSGTGTDRVKTIANGARVYLDASGSTEFTGSYLALSTVNPDYEGTALYGQLYEATMDYTAGIGVQNISYCNICPLPAPVPVPVAPPTPPTFNAWSGTSAVIGDPCLYTTPTTYYTTASIQLSEWAAGMRLYTDSGTTTEITADGRNIGIEDPVTQPGTSEIYVYYTQANGVESVTACSAPSPSPAPGPSPSPVAPPPPTPVPITPFTIYNNGGYSSATGCTVSSSNTRFAATSSAHLQNGDVIYLSSGLNAGNEFDGNNLNFGFSDTVGGSPSVNAFVDTSGVLSSVTNCPPPPVPTTVYSHDIGDWNQSNISVCNDSFVDTVYTAVPYADITINTLVYTDSALSTLFDGSSGIYSDGYFRFGSSGASIPILINSAGQMRNFGIVCP